MSGSRYVAGHVGARPDHEQTRVRARRIAAQGAREETHSTQSCGGTPNAFAPEFVADFNRRFAKAPRNPFNAHRALLPTEVLDEIFTWQETRKLSQSLSFNYQRQLFLLPDTEEHRLLAGQRITVVELSDGTVQARHAGRLLPLTRFGKDDAEITQGAIVSNKLLAGALQFIKDKQAAKDVEKLSKLRTKREKRLLEKRKKRVA